MKKYWEQLKPLERRWAVGIGAFVFLLLNYFFIWPHRHDWARDEARAKAAEEKISTYNAEIVKKPAYLAKLRTLQSGGQDVVAEDQAIDFVHFYSSRLLSNHILLLNGGTLTTRTNNPVFIEQQLGISVQGDETNLVNFLYSLGAGNSMVRVRAMNLHATPDKHELNAGITMVASYLKKVTAAPRTAPAPATKPVKTATAAPQNIPPPPVNKRPPTGPPGPGAKLPPAPAMNASVMSNRMARFLRRGSTNNQPR
ncbi:MAG TPA: hypothetical protein VFB72_12365 [Verrucomicrobiae bacterium]|nr:hypothetical protein [Verrucomicrobiae bacterium]